MYSYEEALCNKKHASNAKDHIKLIHADHPLAVLAEQSSNDKAKTDVQSAEAEAHTVLDLTRETAIVTSAEATTSSPTGKRFFRANEKTLNVLISSFLFLKAHYVRLSLSKMSSARLLAIPPSPFWAVISTIGC